MKKFTILVVLMLCMCTVLLSGCGLLGGPKTLVEEVNLPDVYWLTYESFSEKDGEKEFVCSQGVDANGNIYSFWNGMEYIYLLQPNGRYHVYSHPEGGGWTEPDLNTIFGEVSLDFVTLPLGPYSHDGTGEFSSVKEIEKLTMFGRSCTKYLVTRNVKTTGANFTTTLTDELIIDDETGICLSNIRISKEDPSGVEESYYGTVCTKFETSGFDYQQQINEIFRYTE